MSTTSIKEQITIDQFLELSSKLDIRIGRIIGSEKIPKSSGLKLTVDFGEAETKTAFTNLGNKFAPEVFIGLVCPFVMNLVPTIIKGVNSQVMIMVSTNEDEIHLDNRHIGGKLM